jgi:hypothetical protein
MIPTLCKHRPVRAAEIYRRDRDIKHRLGQGLQLLITQGVNQKLFAAVHPAASAGASDRMLR